MCLNENWGQKNFFFKLEIFLRSDKTTSKFFIFLVRTIHRKPKLVSNTKWSCFNWGFPEDVYKWQGQGGQPTQASMNTPTCLDSPRRAELGWRRNFRDQASTTVREATHRNWTHLTPEGKVLGVGNLRPKIVNLTRWKPTKFIPMKWFKSAFLFNSFIK